MNITASDSLRSLVNNLFTASQHGPHVSWSRTWCVHAPPVAVLKFQGAEIVKLHVLNPNVHDSRYITCSYQRSILPRVKSTMPRSQDQLWATSLFHYGSRNSKDDTRYR